MLGRMKWGWLSLAALLLAAGTLSQWMAPAEAAKSAVEAPEESAANEADEGGVHMLGVSEEGKRFWPRWRGPSGQGWVEGDGYPVTWSSSENVLWKVEVPGQGNSSPVVWGNHIYLTTAYEGGARRSILAFDRSDGSQVWEAFAPADPNNARAYPKNGYASSTPATDGERIYAYMGGHGLVAVDLQGKIAWTAPLGDVSRAFHGTAGSPLLYKDKVILYQDLPDNAFIAAFNKETGQEIWRTSREGRVGWGTPVAIDAGDRAEIIVSSNRAVNAYDPETGEELWRCGGNTFEVIPTPVVGHGLIFCSSGRAGPTLAIRPGGSGDVTETHVEWRAAKGSPFVPSPILHNDLLYMVNDMMSILTVYEAQSGDLVYQARMGKPVREGFSSSPVALDGKLFFTNDEGQTYVVEAGREYKLLHTNELGERVLASPALVDGTWYWRTQNHLLAIGN
ncbi:MAG TPA: PQQ-binding-like beta-propeller repeat protein [Acidobacteriota bacterium]|nr:PQQ-binding-like beta-propeller repeat protein [Acidobacteriota bacterium]